MVAILAKWPAPLRPNRSPASHGCPTASRSSTAPTFISGGFPAQSWDARTAAVRPGHLKREHRACGQPPAYPYRHRHPPAIYRLDLADATTAASARDALHLIKPWGCDAEVCARRPSGRLCIGAIGSSEIWLCDRDGAIRATEPLRRPPASVRRTGLRMAAESCSTFGSQASRRSTSSTEVADRRNDSRPEHRMRHFRRGQPMGETSTFRPNGPVPCGRFGRRRSPDSADGGRRPRLAGIGHHERVMFQNAQDRFRLWSVSIDGGDERPVPDLPRDAWSWTSPPGLMLLTAHRRASVLHAALRHHRPAQSRRWRIPPVCFMPVVDRLEGSAHGALQRRRSQRRRHHARGRD